MQLKILSLILGITVFATALVAQGPPIRLDKPIMLGSGESTARALFSHFDTDHSNYSLLLLEADHNITRNWAVGIEVPWVFASDFGNDRPGDLGIVLKHQFYQNDQMGKTTRISAKAKHAFPTGRDLKIPTAGMGHHKTYLGGLAAYESLSLGIQTEIGYYIVPSESAYNMLNYKLGVGIPLLEPSYPTNQINIYIEAEGMNMESIEGNAQYGYFIAPGLQYARGKYTIEASFQFPISQNMHHTYERNWNFLAGGRMVL